MLAQQIPGRCSADALIYAADPPRAYAVVKDAAAYRDNDEHDPAVGSTSSQALRWPGVTGGYGVQLPPAAGRQLSAMRVLYAPKRYPVV